MAARLGRGFLPLAGLFAAGLVGVLGSTPGGWPTAVGAVAAAGALLAHGLSIVQGALGRSRRPWMVLAGVGIVVPPLYASYVLGWRGLRALGSAAGPLQLLTATLYVALGVWVLRGWLRVMEVQRLAHVMSSNLPGDGESA